MATAFTENISQNYGNYSFLDFVVFLYANTIQQLAANLAKKKCSDFCSD